MRENLLKFLENWSDLVQPIAKDRVFAWTPLIPQAKQSTSFGQFRAFVPKKKAQYMKDLREDFKYNLGDRQICGPCRLTVLFANEHRGSKQDLTIVKILHWCLHWVRPDVDNLLKPIMDSLNRVLPDDAQICVLQAIKIRYAVPCIALILEPIQEKAAFPKLIIPLEISA